MAQSKLVKFDKKFDQNGNQKFWEMEKFPGKNWDFTLIFENGDTGTASSKNQEGSWSIGKEYTYEVQDSNGWKKFKNVKSLDAAARSGSWGGGHREPYVSPFEKPEVQQRITKAFALETAATYLSLPHVKQEEVKKESVTVLADHIFKFCYHTIDLNEKNWHVNLLARRQALTVAMVEIKIDIMAIDTWTKLAGKAEENYAYLKVTDEQKQ